MSQRPETATHDYRFGPGPAWVPHPPRYSTRPGSGPIYLPQASGTGARLLAWLLVSAVSLFGCSSTPDSRQLSEVPAGAEGGAGDLAAFQAENIDPASLRQERIVYFAFDSSVVPDQFETLLDQHAEYLMADPDAALRLEGHADERGTREYNVGLGERRSQSVRQGLLLRGVPRTQLQLISFGEERPAVEGDDKQSHSRNRRVEFRYLTGLLSDDQSSAR